MSYIETVDFDSITDHYIMTSKPRDVIGLEMSDDSVEWTFKSSFPYLTDFEWSEALARKWIDAQLPDVRDTVLKAVKNMPHMQARVRSPVALHKYDAWFCLVQAKFGGVSYTPLTLSPGRTYVEARNHAASRLYAGARAHIIRQRGSEHPEPEHDAILSLLHTHFDFKPDWSLCPRCDGSVNGSLTIRSITYDASTTTRREPIYMNPTQSGRSILKEGIGADFLMHNSDHYLFCGVCHASDIHISEVLVQYDLKPSPRFPLNGELHDAVRRPSR